MNAPSPHDAIRAAQVVIDLIQRGQPIGTRHLSVLSAATDEPTAFLRRRRRSGFVIACHTQRAHALAFLTDFIEDRELEARQN